MGNGSAQFTYLSHSPVVMVQAETFMSRSMLIGSDTSGVADGDADGDEERRKKVGLLDGLADGLSDGFSDSSHGGGWHQLRHSVWY